MDEAFEGSGAEAEAQLLPVPPCVEFWLAEGVRERCSDEELAATAEETLEWLKPALREMYKSRRIKQAVGDLFNAFEFTTNLGSYGIFESLRGFCQETAHELGLDMRDFFDEAGLAESLGRFEATVVRDSPIRRQDDPAVGLPEPPRLPGHSPLQHENVVLHMLILVSRALDAGFHAIVKMLARKNRGKHKAAPTKGHARMMNKAVAKDDHRFAKAPVVMQNIDTVRCAVTFDSVDDMKAMLSDLEQQFGPPARDKNMFAFDEARAAAQLHYRTFMRNCVYAPKGLTYGRLASQHSAAWRKYLDSPPEDPNEPWARFRADAGRALEFLRTPGIAERPVRLVCEVQCLLQQYLDGRLKMHGLYKVIRATDEHALYSDFKRAADGEGYPEGTTWDAVQREALEEVRLRLDGGQDVNQAAGEAGMTMLLAEADKGHVDAVQLLLARGADTDQATTDDGATALYLAAEKGHADVAQALLDASAAVDQATIDAGVTPLSIAAVNGHIEIVQALLAHGADVNLAITSDGRTPLWRAAYHGHIDIVQALLEAGADADSARSDGCTPLWKAAANGHVDAVRALLLKDADVNLAKLDDGVTPLNMAAFKGYADVVQALLLGRADVDQATDTEGTTPLYVAAETGNLDVVQALLRNGADTDKATTDDGTPPLYVAAQHRRTEVVRALLSAGADANKATEDDGSTPLYVAAESGSIDVVDVLVEWGADVNRGLTSDRTTPLFMAAYNGHEDVVRHLLQKGAKADIKCDFGTALQGARRKGYAGIVAIFSEFAPSSG